MGYTYEFWVVSTVSGLRAGYRFQVVALESGMSSAKDLNEMETPNPNPRTQHSSGAGLGCRRAPSD